MLAHRLISLLKYPHFYNKCEAPTLVWLAASTAHPPRPNFKQCVQACASGACACSKGDVATLNVPFTKTKQILHTVPSVSPIFDKHYEKNKLSFIHADDGITCSTQQT